MCKHFNFCCFGFFFFGSIVDAKPNSPFCSFVYRVHAEDYGRHRSRETCSGVTIQITCTYKSMFLVLFFSLFFISLFEFSLSLSSSLQFCGCNQVRSGHSTNNLAIAIFPWLLSILLFVCVYVWMLNEESIMKNWPPKFQLSNHREKKVTAHCTILHHRFPSFVFCPFETYSL